ncbi:unannotated protein [freshwater metagenome]|uniref:Unannotated protein n=1 Tax=freshwater metagenome TaxID=449393 RepID=A0A6J7U8V0_9ZZZZ
MRSVAATVPGKYAGVKYVIVIPAARAGIVTARLATMATDATTANNFNFFTMYSFEVGRFDHPV